MAVIVRDARREDAPGVAALLDELGYPSTTADAAEHIRRLTADPATRLKLADDGELVLGLIATHIVPRLDRDRITCRILDIVVAREHRREGIGTILLTAAEQHAAQSGSVRLDLSSGDWREDAHAFYIAHGFEVRSRGFTKRLPL